MGISTQIVTCFGRLAAGCRDIEVDQQRRKVQLDWAGAFGLL